MDLTMDYVGLSDRVMSLCEGETDAVSLMATLSCEVFHSDQRFDWVGFYRVTAPEVLKVGPYQGSHGCLVIPFSRGVCGACARTGKTQRIDDVEAFAGHIACSSTTRSELVLPVFNAGGELIAVFDIDSNQPAAFSAQDAEQMEKILAQVFGKEGIA